MGSWQGKPGRQGQSVHDQIQTHVFRTIHHDHPTLSTGRPGRVSFKESICACDRPWAEIRIGSCDARRLEQLCDTTWAVNLHRRRLFPSPFVSLNGSELHTYQAIDTVYNTSSSTVQVLDKLTHVITGRQNFRFRRTTGKCPNTTTGPHPANNSAKCCVPIGVGFGLDVATSIIVDIHARIWTTMNAI